MFKINQPLLTMGETLHGQSRTWQSSEKNEWMIPQTELRSAEMKNAGHGD